MAQPTLNPSHEKPTFGDAFNPRQNAFGPLRLVLAVLVIFSHSFPLGGFGPEPLVSLTHGRQTIGLVAVAMFFVLSGFLITRSASQSVSVGRFVWHRFLRIFPGYWVCLIVCAFVFAPLIALVEHGTVMRIFSAPRASPQEYVLHNAALFHLNDFSLLGVVNIWPQGFAGLLARNPTAHVINGSLWTLPFEVACYAGIAALALCGLVRRGRVVFLALFLGLYFLYAYSFLDPQSFDRSFRVPGLQVFIPLALSFSAGSLCFVYRDKVPFSGWIFAVSVVALAVSLPLGFFSLAMPVFMTYAFFWLAFTFSFPRFDAKGDYSYGTYIYAFPVQQALALAGLQEEGLVLYFSASLVITVMLAVLSYRLVEAPALRWKNADLLASIRNRIGRPTSPAVVTTETEPVGVEA